MNNPPQQPKQKAHNSAILPAGIRVIVEEFVEQHGALLTDPNAAYDLCKVASEEFVAACQGHHVLAEVICGVQVGEHPAFPGIRLLQNGHFAVLVPGGDDGIVIDWTARQFDPQAQVPAVLPLAEWRATWPDIDTALGLATKH